MAENYLTDQSSVDFERFHQVDVVVAGGGMAGVACALSSARLGLKTLLVQNRYCLGGVAGEEIDCDANGGLIGGASEYKTRDARETGVIEEIRLTGEWYYQNGYRRYWSLMLRELCEKEENLILLLNTEIYDVSVQNHTITSLTARTLGSELTHHITAQTVIDCTGDSFPSFKAGAKYRLGREAKSEFNETLAPEQSDSFVLGSSIFFRAADQKEPVKFIPPSGAYNLKDESLFVGRPHHDISKGYYWLECGGDMDTISDNETIYRKLLNILYGVWDHIKNQGEHGAANYAIDWVSGCPGKRESRRLIGDYILRQDDIVDNRQFSDGVSYGGANVDLHPIKGFFSGSTPSGPEHGIMSPGLYQIPFRCYFSCNINNLLMAGRNISVSHVAHSSTRWMATCAAGGQVVAGAAFMMKKYGSFPREIGKKYLPELRYILYRIDHTVPGIAITDPLNLCANAQVSASSSRSLIIDHIDYNEPLLDNDISSAISFVASTTLLNSVFFKMSNTGTEPQKVTAQLVKMLNMFDFEHGRIIVESEQMVVPGKLQEVEFYLPATLQREERYYIRFKSLSKELQIAVGDCYLPGVYKSRMRYPAWPPRGDNHNLCCRFEPEQRPFEAENILNANNRGGDFLSCWISDHKLPLPQSVEITFPHPTLCSCVELIFDTNLDSINIYQFQKECVKSYRLEAFDGNQNWELAVVKDNFLRFRRHVFSARRFKSLKLTILETNGATEARVYQIRAYQSDKY